MRCLQLRIPSTDLGASFLAALMGGLPFLVESSAGPVLAAYDGIAELERGLDILLSGLTTTLTPPGQTHPPAPAQHPVG
jgi:hypothetical protein